MYGSREKGRSNLLCEEAFHHRGGCGDSVLSFHFCPGASNHIFWRDGTGKCVYVHFHAHLHHDCQADCLDVGIYSGVWIQSGRGCEVLYGCVDPLYVDLPGVLGDGSCKSF